MMESSQSMNIGLDYEVNSEDIRHRSMEIWLKSVSFSCDVHHYFAGTKPQNMVML